MKSFVGMKCGKWNVEGPMQRSPSGRKWWCICDCGATAWVLEFTLKRTKQGCRKCLAEFNSKLYTTHGLSSDPNFRRYQSMVGRCHDPDDKAYRRYGGRGILVCDRWLNGEGGLSGYECFSDDMKPPKRRGWHLHRFDNDKGYEPENCVWVSIREHGRIHRKAGGHSKGGERG